MKSELDIPGRQQTGQSPAQGTMNHPSSGYLEQESPPESEISVIARSLFKHVGLSWLLRSPVQPVVLALFGFLNCCISIGVMAALSAMTHCPLVFPSLGPTAFLFFYAPTTPAASPRNTIVGHSIGTLAGYASLVVTGLTTAGPALIEGVTWPRVIAAALSLGLTSGLMALLKSPHPPAGSTTLTVSLGLLSRPWQLLLLMTAVVLLTLQATIIHHFTGIPYPRWSPPPPSTTG